MIRFFNEGISYKPKQIRSLRLWLDTVILSHKQEAGDISFIFCDDARLLKMNNQFLRHDYYTDVITFDYSHENLVSGDVFISIDRVRDNARELDVPVSEEVKRVMVHGLLHLLGYSDKEAAEIKRMRAAEERFLKKFEG